MAQLGTTLDPNAIDPAQNGFDNLPDGEYIAQIVANEVRHTKANTGLILILTWEIIEGEYTNRKIWQNINYQNESAEAQAIGQGQIKNICDAIGYKQHFNDGDVLMFQPCRVRIGLGKKQEGYERRNEIKSVKPMTATAPAGTPAIAPASKPATAPKAPVGPAAAGRRPWDRPAA
jgi:Protein of unknown function (DUF669)